MSDLAKKFFLYKNFPVEVLLKVNILCSFGQDGINVIELHPHLFPSLSFLLFSFCILALKRPQFFSIVYMESIRTGPFYNDRIS